MSMLRRTAASLTLLLLATTGALAQVKSHQDIKTPPLRKFAMPQPTRIQLANGMVIFLQEDKELPLIRGRATIRGGSRDVPAAKAGLANIYSQAWRTGGTTAKTGDELDQFLEARAARVETGNDTDSTNVSLDVLKGDFDTVFPIFVDLLKNPAFRQDKIDLAKTQANTAISRRNDEPGGILGRELTKLGYGANSPYAVQTEYATIASITRDDLLAFHKRTVHPNNMIVSFIGDFDARKMEKRLRDTFGSWKKGTRLSKPDPAIAAAKPGLYFVAKDDVTQGNIAMVHAGTERNNPDYYALVVMNDVFSGGFSGRLMMKLRSERGLTYGVGGGVGAPWDYPGLFRVQMATKSGTTLEALEALKGEIVRLTTAPVTAEELSLAKESILNAFVFTMDTREKALQQQVLLEFYGFPADYFTKYPSMIEKVTAADVERVAKKYVHPDQLAILVVGKEKDFEKPLSSLGAVTPIDITIPEVDAGKPKPAAAASSSAEGMALARKVADFAGGKAKIDAVQATRAVGSMVMKTPQGEVQIEVDQTISYPGSQRMVMKTPMGEMTQVIGPDGAFAIMPGGMTQDLPGSRRDQMSESLRTDMFAILKNLDNPKYKFNITGTEKVGDVEATVLSIDADGVALRWLVDPSSGRLLRKIGKNRGPAGGEQATDYTDWKMIDGVNIAMAGKVLQNGEEAGKMTMTSAEVNPTVDPKSFQKPAPPQQ